MIERGGVPHRLIDRRPRTTLLKFTLDDWLRGASAIDNIQARGGVPIVVGGTSLYVQSLVRGMFEARRRMNRSASNRDDVGGRRAELERIDPGGRASTRTMRPDDPRIEVFRLTGRLISELRKRSGLPTKGPVRRARSGCSC